MLRLVCVDTFHFPLFIKNCMDLAVKILSEIVDSLAKFLFSEQAFANADCEKSVFLQCIAIHQSSSYLKKIPFEIV